MSLAAALTLIGLVYVVGFVFGFACGAWITKDNGPEQHYHIGLHAVTETTEPRYNSRSEKR